MPGPSYVPKLNHAQRLARRVQISEEIKAGASLEDVAKKYNVTWSTVRLACIEYGVVPPKVLGKVSRLLQFKIVLLLIEGESSETLAKRFNVALHLVLDIKHDAKKAGFTFKRRR